MAVTIQVENGKVVGEQLNEKLATRLCRYTSGLFAPIQFKGFWRVTKLICKLFNISERQWVSLANGLEFSIDLTDPYWNRMISPHFAYEPEIMHLLNRMKDLDYSFIDCGANMGYWSCLAASEAFGAKQVYAIEPLSDNYQLLQVHANRNQQNIHLFKNAIAQNHGVDVPLFKPGSHASVSLLKHASEGTPTEVVKTITLDSMLHTYLQDTDNIFLKLDVEGVEIEALKGATTLLAEKKPLIIYEDHSNDANSAISDYILNQLGYTVLYLDEALQCHQMTSVAQINAIKVKANHGYNFIAFDPQSLFANQAMSACLKSVNRVA